jgi:hypothetical protein
VAIGKHFHFAVGVEFGVGQRLQHEQELARFSGLRQPPDFVFQSRLEQRQEQQQGHERHAGHRDGEQHRRVDRRRQECDKRWHYHYCAPTVSR